MSEAAALQGKEARVKEIAERLASIEAILAMYKTYFQEKEELALELRDLVGLDTEVISGDNIFTVVDNFANANTVFRTAAVKRYELKVDSVNLRTEKLLKGNKKK